MSISDTADNAQPTPGQALPATSVERLIGAPLPQLLAEHDAEIVEITSIDDYRFFGWLVQKKSGRVLLCMPAGRTDVERDCTARMLLAHLDGLPLDQFPDVLTVVTDVVKGGVDVL
ncbi:hypothetical protein K388_01892 [Streptomyces sp. KhCrAH-43]|uniref:hypothetical protein n=1 Tax=unclassified Streptomyces TaxID=2593676 RepID=UPI0003815382|nr:MULTISPECIES: hypothetical protein [unclassified Streptomyces]MYS34894.1 hypothetical protein [Streptomyces sp. SID4920]MYX65329.1 hypothetical protein [Streptomyces sp. SID8373]RAJ64697.1 hypothetical protein K388_01892 [Streptomyces sp. KhCrAH-43]